MNYPTEEELFLEFQERWNLDRIKEMTLEEYTNTLSSANGIRDDFTYWIENKLDSIGSIWGGSSFKFGIYRRNDSSKNKKNDATRKYDQEYAWLVKYGSTREEAFQKVKNIIIQIIEASLANDLDKIDSLDLGDAFKWKIAFHYQNINDIKIVDIFQVEALKKINDSFLKNEKFKISEIHKKLLADKQYTLETMRDEKAIPLWDKYGVDHYSDYTDFKANDDFQKSKYNTTQNQQPLNQILYGPPGTGKTFHTISKALEILEGESVDLNQPLSETQRKSLKEKFDSYIKEEQIFFVTFHQSYGYEEFVEGIQAKTSKSGEIFYQVENGIFKEICQRAKIAKNKKFVLIIDEINRGNVSKIFGELITLIEPSKRGGESEELSAALPYSKESFSVPKNLYIIGTMNTADRSITALDTALRRRFDFVEMMPNLLLLKENCEEVDLQKLLQALNERIEFLLDREKTIGHAFLLEAHTLMDLKNVFRKKIIPLLQEYFYEDYALIDAVLNHNGMIKRETQTPQNLFPKSLLEELEGKTLYSIASERDPIWDNPSTYQNIYTKHNQGNE